MHPTIGIFAQERHHAGRIFHNLSFDYTRSVEEAGAVVVIIPIFSSHIGSYIELCDGFIFPGGPDIDPSLYGQEKQGSRGISPEYDRYLLSAMRMIFQTNKPILGICKGMQLLNIAHGGTMKQDIDEHLHHFQPERGYEYIDTAIIGESGSFLASLFAMDTIEINSIHHQAIDSLGESLQISATSQYDGEIEAIEHNSLPYYGVQWHPEYLESHRPLFRYFVDQCSKL